MVNDVEDFITKIDTTFLSLSESDFTQYDNNKEGRDKYQEKVEKIILYIKDCISYLQTTFKTKNTDIDYINFEEFITNRVDNTNSNIVELTKQDFTIAKRDASRNHHISPNTLSTNYVIHLMSNYQEYMEFFNNNQYGYIYFITFNKAKTVRNNSGIESVAIVTSPGEFSCPMNCYYCPNEPGQPRSYLKDEPAVARANRNKFDAIYQIWERCSVLYLNGGSVDKLEIIVLGGTWSGYPVEYQEKYIRDIYYAANTFFYPKTRCDKPDEETGVYYNYVPNRPRLSLEEEIQLNTNSPLKIIGLTLETRPDWITPEEIVRLRRYNCTRVQIGIQHTNDNILKKINRGCTTQDAKDAIKLLKDNSFKVDIHLMPDLPGSTPELDRDMFDTILTDPDLQADQMKIYPCETTPYTVIKKWYDEGKYQHYDERTLIELIKEFMHNVHPWIRLNRVIRDIPSQYIVAGLGDSNRPDMRSMIQKEMVEEGLSSLCIRNREPKNNKKALTAFMNGNVKLTIRSYPSSGGIEVFISLESDNEHTHKETRFIYGFCRLRIPNKDNTTLVFPGLNECAMIRELHVYGTMNKVGINTLENSFQHSGIGKQLVGYAIRITRDYGYNKLSVISGVGVRNYYKHLGFTHLDEESQCLIMNINSITPQQYYALFSKHSDTEPDFETDNRVINQNYELVNQIPELNGINETSNIFLILMRLFVLISIVLFTYIIIIIVL